MLSIEYRGVGGAILTQYSALNTSQTAMLPGGKFFIPNNVHIMGTMNTIDRSVESFDLALRRRFRWERIDPEIEVLRYHLNSNGLNQWSGLADNLNSLNKCIRGEDILGADYEIGHAYLMNLRYPSALSLSEVRKSVWRDSIKPLLEEYVRGSEHSKELMPKFQNAFGVQ